MSKTIEEAAKAHAKSLRECGMYDNETPATEEDMACSFKGGVKWLLSLPLRDRLTAEEKERVRKEYANTYPNDIDCGVENMLIQGVLERIFGKEFFKEEE